MLVVRCDGCLVSCIEGYLVTATEPFAVVVVWVKNDPRWRGSVTTLDGRSVRFSQSDVEDDAFQDWLRDLPGWDPEKLRHAMTSPGVYLVWRRPGA